jgi:Nuclease-related domain
VADWSAAPGPATAGKAAPAAARDHLLAQPLSQADLQAILAHLGDDLDELLAGTIGDRPVVAVRVWASVGRPGGSAQAQWRRLRAAEWAAWTRTLPLRLAAVLAVATVGGLLASLLAPRLSLVLGGLAAVAAGWGLRFRPSREALAWRRGAMGERRTARLLEPLERQGWVVLHDLAVPRRQANIDHLMIGPGGVFVIDSKQYRGRLQLDGSGRLWHGRYPLVPALRAVSFEADQAARVLPDPGVAVVPIVAVHGAQVPWGKVVIDGVPVVAARRLPSMLGQLPVVLGPERVAWLADQARVRFHAAG